MLVGDQRALNGLLFARRCLRDRVYMEEWRAGIGQTHEDPRLPSYNFTQTTRSAASVDEFLAACRAEPMVATAHLRHGYLEP